LSSQLCLSAAASSKSHAISGKGPSALCGDR
jgi:hypothetical protein